MRVNSIGYDEKYVIYTYFELTRRVICVSNTKLEKERYEEIICFMCMLLL